MKPMRIAYKKDNNKWAVCFTENNETAVFKALAADLVAKKINQARYIKTIKRVQRYSHVTITVTYDNNTKSVYYVPAHF